MYFDVVADVDDPVWIDAQHDDVRGVEAVAVMLVVHGRVSNADVVGPLVEFKGCAAAQVRHRVLEHKLLLIHLKQVDLEH